MNAIPEKYDVDVNFPLFKLCVYNSESNFSNEHCVSKFFSNDENG